MDDYKSINNIKSIPEYFSAMKKLTVNPVDLSEEEKTYLLTCAILLIKKYQKDTQYRSYIELAYYIVLKYSLTFNDYEPLYDFCVNFGFYPVSQAILDQEAIEFDNIPFSLIGQQVLRQFKRDSIIETLEQKRSREEILKSQAVELSYIAPTSFGKSSIISDHITTHNQDANRIAIIVPTKSLLMQTYRTIRKANLGRKLLIHDEMFDGEDRFIAIFTQERALRLLDKHNISFDTLYIDEAHRLLERDSRSVLLSRLIKLNRLRNPDTRLIYLSPLLKDSDNLKLFNDQTIFERRIQFNIKEPELYEYRDDKKAYKYNRFIDTFFETGHFASLFDYIHHNKTGKTFCYLYSPRKIEQFAAQLSASCENRENSSLLNETIRNLSKYVHENFYVIDYLKKGVVYLHAKMPDTIKEYLEYKFSVVPDIQFIVANKVILEGINLPIDSLFILNGRNLREKELINLIGRVNRLGEVFSPTPNLQKLLPPVHFVNSDEFNQVRGKLENKIRLLKGFSYADNIKNPLLENYDQSLETSESVREKTKRILADENSFFVSTNDPVQVLKQKIIALGMNAIYNVSDDMCQLILHKINKIQNHPNLHKSHFLERLRYVFVRHLDTYIEDEEFSRLKNDQAIAYYKMHFENRKKSLKENIAAEVHFFEKRSKERDSLLYIGESYGEIPYPGTNPRTGRKVYIDLSTKTKIEMVNIAIAKLKIEEDFVNYKLHMFFQLMYDYNLLSTQEYHNIIYGTDDPKKLRLVKMGLTINVINRLEDDGQLKNLFVDHHNNICANPDFAAYKEGIDDFFRFELEKFL